MSDIDTLLHAYGPTGQLSLYLGTAYYDFTYDPEGNYLQRSFYNSTNAARDTALYESYGNPLGDMLSSTGNPVNHDSIGFGAQYGYYNDNETGLVLLGHRYYDPGKGRFINRDPIGYNGGINLYGYAGGNPIKFADPSGFDRIVIAGGISVKDKNRHDKANDNFINAAVRCINGMRRNTKTEPITLIMYAPSYEARAIFEGKDKDHFFKVMKRSAKKYNFNLVTIRNSEELTQILNNSKQGSINSVTYYGHSAYDAMLLDYSIDGQAGSRDYWNIDKASKLHSNIFSKGAIFESYGCFQGLPGGLMEYIHGRYKIKTIGALGFSHYDTNPYYLPPYVEEGYKTYQ